MQKMIAFHHDKDNNMLKLGYTLPNLANISLHQSTEENSVHSRKEMKTFWKKIEKMLLVVHLSFLHAKQLLMKHLFENRQTYANLQCKLIVGNYTTTWHVNSCQPVFIRIGISNQGHVDSRPDKTRRIVSKIWSCLIFNEPDQVANRVFLQQVDRKKWLLQYWWFSLALHQWVWSHGLPLSLFSLSRISTVFQWGGHSTL